MLHFKYTGLFIVLILWADLSGQVDSLLSDLIDSDQASSDLSDWLVMLATDMIDINSASREELEQFSFLDNRQINHLIKKRPFNRKSELKQILGSHLYRQISPFIQIKKVVEYPQLRFSQRFLYTFEKSRAVEQNLYLGLPFESLTRLRLILHPAIQSGFLVQKDVGEKSFFDHFSGYLCWQPHTLNLKLVFGNFIVQAAEGLVFSSLYTPPIHFMTRHRGSAIMVKLRPLLSTNEGGGFAGVALSGNPFDQVKLLFFYSQTPRDIRHAREDQQISGFDYSGYHRTVAEKAGANGLLEKTIGASMTFPFFLFRQIGFNFVNTHYSQPLVSERSDNEKRRRYFSFHGSKIQCFSLFYKLKTDDLILAGELIPQSSSSISQKHTLSIKSGTITLTCQYWFLASDLQSPFGRTSAKSGAFPQNSQGFMFGIYSQPIANLNCNFSWVYQKDLWRTYFQPMPLTDKEFNARFEYRFSSKQNISLRYKCDLSHFFTADKDKLAKKRRYKFRLQFNKKINKTIRLKTSFEKSLVLFSTEDPTSSGIDIYQDIYCHIDDLAVIQMRYSSFFTTDYESRLYEYENDLPYLFSNRLLQGSGKKYYLYIKTSLTNNIKIMFKYSWIHYDGIEKIGNGLSEIEGNVRQDIHFQLDYRF